MTDITIAPPSSELGRVDQDTQRLALAASTWTEQAAAFTCDSRAAFMEGAALLRAVKADHDHLEDKRVSVTGPLNEALRVFNGWFRTPLDRLKSAENVLKKKLGAFEQEEKRREEEAQRKRDAEAEANRQELERRAQAAAEKGNLEKALALQSRASAVVPQKADIIAPKAKGMGFGEKWDFEIEDVSKIPREYLVPDMAKIRLMVKALKNKEHAERQIPGIKVTVTVNVSVRV